MQQCVGKGLQQSSGRVIALGRLMLATLYLIAVWVDAELPIHEPSATYGLLVHPILCSRTLIAITTWCSWWYDARLAGPAHAVDIIVFTLLVLFTDGHTSPYFAFFMFVMLSAAIRWGWRATALTAVLLALLFTITGSAGLDARGGTGARSFRHQGRSSCHIVDDPHLVRSQPAMAALRSRRNETEQPTRP